MTTKALQAPVEVTAKGSKLHIVIETNVKGKPSGSGKNDVIATTAGFTGTPLEGVRLGLNLIRSKN